MSGVPTGVGRTAFGVAMIRALESRRTDRLFHDPYAAAFLAAAKSVFDPHNRGALGWAANLSAVGGEFWSQVVIRTRFFDDYLIDATGRGLSQVVLVAVGLDTRAYRLHWPPGVRLFELDLPEVLDFKNRILTGRQAIPRCRRRSVAVDFRTDWATPLTQAGFDRGEPTAWLLEGLLIYLSADEVRDLLTSLNDLSAPGSQLAFEHEDFDTARTQSHAPTALTEHAGLWQGGLPDAPDWLAMRGWQIEIHQRATIASRYQRGTAHPTEGGFLTATLSA